MAWIESQVGPWPLLADRFEPELTLPGFCYDQAKLKDECESLRLHVGFIPWRSTSGDTLTGMSTHFDPQLPADEMYCGSFGHPRYRSFSPTDYYHQPAKDLPTAKRADYLDILGFRNVCPEVLKKPELMRIISGFKVPVVRGSIRVIDGSKAHASMNDGAGMHVDEHPCKAMRLNLSIQTSDDFGLQYVGHAPLIAKSGEHRIVCTDVKHRAWVRKRNDLKRVHLVVDVLPWLSYDSVRDAYFVNKFFGVKHPYDMVVAGEIWGEC